MLGGWWLEPVGKDLHGPMGYNKEKISGYQISSICNDQSIWLTVIKPYDHINNL